MKITIPTRGEVDLTELLKESSEQRIKQPNIVVNCLVRELIDACEIIQRLTNSNTDKEAELIDLKEKNEKLCEELILHRNNAKVIKELFLS